MLLKKYIGDRAFYAKVLAIAIPIIIQNGITNFVSLLDNIMVGQIGTVEMNAVSIVNQILFVFNLCVFGAVSGAGIFTAQFFGSGDKKGVRYTMRFKVLVGLFISAVGIALFVFFGDTLINLYLKGEGDPAEAAASLEYGLDYIKVMIFGLVPFALANAYSSTHRETGHTVIPMIGGIIAVFVNLLLNWVLIFGHLGAPKMGVVGAALATVISRYVELVFVALAAHINKSEKEMFCGVYRSFYIPKKLFAGIILKGMPLLVNEALWATSVAMITQCYTTKGLDVVGALNISNTLNNLASVVFLSMGNTVGIMIGQMLGAGRSKEEVIDYDRKLIATSVCSCLVFGGIMAAVSPVFPLLYKTSDSVRGLATALIIVAACHMPFNAYTNAAYFTLRSGGQTAVTFVFDSCFMWVVSLPLAFVLSRYTPIPIIPLYIICQSADLLKCALGAYMIKRGTWLCNIVSDS